jgi:hypothetical protein
MISLPLRHKMLVMLVERYEYQWGSLRRMLATQSVSVEMPRKRLLRLIAEEAFHAAGPLRLRLELLVFWTG